MHAISEPVDWLGTHPCLPKILSQPLCAFLPLQLRLWCDCPFWREDGMCHSRDCSVGECTDEEVPGPLKLRSSSLPARSTAGVSASEKTEGDASTTFSAVDLTVDHSAFRSWVEEDNPWTHDNEANNGWFMPLLQTSQGEQLRENSSTSYVQANCTVPVAPVPVRGNSACASLLGRQTPSMHAPEYVRPLRCLSSWRWLQRRAPM